MGTKNNPGEFDCYAETDPNEPYFLLRAHDPLAPLIVEEWADRYLITKLQSGSASGTIDARRIVQKYGEARMLAADMRLWYQEYQHRPRLPLEEEQRTLTETLGKTDVVGKVIDSGMYAGLDRDKVPSECSHVLIVNGYCNACGTKQPDGQPVDY